MKKCPYCAEEIQDEAVKCKHCMEFLDESRRPQPIAQPPALPQAPAKPDDGLPWYLKTGSIVLTFLMVPPLAIPLIWMRPKLHWGWKVGHTVGILVICWIMVKAMVAFVSMFDEALEMMNSGGMGL